MDKTFLTLKIVRSVSTINTTLMVRIMVSSGIYFKTAAPANEKIPPKTINDLYSGLTSPLSFFCNTIIVDEIRLQTNSTGIISTGEYHINKGGKATKAKPKPVIPFIRLATETISNIQNNSIPFIF